MHPKRRDTIPSRIREAVSNPTKIDSLFGGLTVALYGRDLSNIELLVNQFFNWRERLMKTASIPSIPALNGPDSERQVAERGYREIEKALCDIFINAVVSHDKKTIMKLGEAAEFFKNKLGEDFVPADPLRHRLLRLKIPTSSRSKRLTLRQIAEKVYNHRQIIEAACTGFSDLRKLCKELKVPIRPSRKIKAH